MTDWYKFDVETVEEELKTSVNDGLSKSEAQNRLTQYGPNELIDRGTKSVWLILLDQFKDVMVVILFVAALVSLVLQEYVDVIVIMAIVVINAIIGFSQEYRAERAVAALKKLAVPTVKVRRDGRIEEISARELVPGDVVILEAGNLAPADGRLLTSVNLKVEEAALTGESEAVVKVTDALTDEDKPVGDRRNMIFMGTVIAYGRGTAIITDTGMNTELGNIADLIQSVSQEQTPLQRRLAQLGISLGAVSLAIIAIVIVLGLLRSEEWQILVLTAISMAVAAVPEGLPAVVSVTLALGAQRMLKRHALIRKLPAVETLGSVTVICSDKTGTITRGEMTVRQVYLPASGFIDVSGTGYLPQGQFSPSDPSLLSPPGPLHQLLLSGLLCNDASLMQTDGHWTIKGDPTEAALVVLAEKAQLNTPHFRRHNPRTTECPFSSERKLMTTVHRMEEGSFQSFTKGAPEVLVPKCSHVQGKDGARPITDEDRTSLAQANDTMASHGLRVLALAGKAADTTCPVETLEAQMTFLGFVGMMDPPREEAVLAVKTAREVSIRPVMITGDHKLTALAIAREVGIYQDGDRVMTGEQLEALSDAEFESIVSEISVYARVSPMDKLRIVQAWKKRGDIVAMTGDGVNDAPALKQADIGIAMGLSGTAVSKEAADMVLRDDNFATIISAIERGRWIYDNIKKYLTYLLRANLIEVIFLGGIVTLLGPRFLPMLPAAILFINLATDGLPALALGIAPPDPDIMKRPPRDPSESIFSREVLTFILLAIVVECPFFFWVFLRNTDALPTARADIFMMFVFIELLIALNFRSLRYSIFRTPPHAWLWAAVGATLLLTAATLAIPDVREAFGLGMPSIGDAWILGMLALLVIGSIETAKALLRRRGT